MTELVLTDERITDERAIDERAIDERDINGRLREKELQDFYHAPGFSEKYVYKGHDLGAVCSGEGTVFKLWSPAADRVVLSLYDDGQENASFRSVSMERVEQGVWLYRTEENLHGTYYDYEVSVCGVTRRTGDPYARACGVNSLRSMVLEPGSTDPEGWEADRAPARQQEDIIYELHVKEFSWDDSAGFPEWCRGTYKAFTVEDTALFGDGQHPTGIRYLKELGVTHIQLMPVYDFGSVDEAGDKNQFNWGYDPVCYNVPEGSYSSDPFHGEVRIRELKELVQSLHRNGFRVIMDVVYNHTYSADSYFQRTAPEYYYRRNEDGTLSDGSGCGNDFAAEREMAASFILDSVLYWAEEYHMDGFRFDLMGLLPVELMNRIQIALDKRFGDGEKLIYGEPWAADRTAMEPGFHQAVKKNAGLFHPRIGLFCDKTRDAIRGHVFDSSEPGFVGGRKGLEREILHSVSAWCDGKGAFKAGSPKRVLSYVSAHDNHTLWDKLILSMAPEAGFYHKPEAVVSAYKLAVTIYFTCQGRIFFLSGEEFARTKEGDDNSFQSPVERNRLDYKRAYEFGDLVRFYQDLIALRKCLPGLCDKSERAGARIFNKNLRQKGVVSFLVDNRTSAGNVSEGVSGAVSDVVSGVVSDAEKEPGREPEREPEKKTEITDRWQTLFIAYNSRRSPVCLTLPEGCWQALIMEGDSGLWRQLNPRTYAGKLVLPPLSAAVMGIGRVWKQEEKR